MGKPQTFAELVAALSTHLAQSTSLLAQLTTAEVMQPLPARGLDETDAAARRVPCPACDARAGNPCAWARPREQQSYVAHASRRALVQP